MTSSSVNIRGTAMVEQGVFVGGNFTYNADNEMTSFLFGNPLTYDANGNLTSDGQNTYTWDARNHLSAISGGSFSFAYAYDALDRRVSKAVAGTTAQFVYDGLNPVQELQSGSASANLLTGLNLDEYFQRTDSAGELAAWRGGLYSMRPIFWRRRPKNPARSTPALVTIGIVACGLPASRTVRSPTWVPG